MAVGITSLPRLGWGNACDPRAVQLQTSHLDDTSEIQGTSAGFEGVAFPFLTLQRGRSLVSTCPHPTKPFPTPSSSPWSPHIPHIFLRCPQQTQGKENGVWVCSYVGRGQGRNRDFPRDSDGEQQLSPTQGWPFGSPWLCVKASEATTGLLPTRNVANCAVKTSCMCLTPLCLLPKHSTEQFKLTQRILSSPSWQWLCCTALLVSLPLSLLPPVQVLGQPQLGPTGLRVPVLPVSLALVHGKPHPDLFQF